MDEYESDGENNQENKIQKLVDQFDKEQLDSHEDNEEDEDLQNRKV